MKTLNGSTLVLGLFMVDILFGCHGGRLATRPSGLPSITVGQLIDSLETTSNYDLLSAKLSVDHSTEQKTQRFGARLRIKKDSVIWLSITPGLGIEAVRVVITPDSIKMLNRLEQKYFVESFDRTSELLKMDVSFQILQSALMGEFPLIHDQRSYRLDPIVDLYHLEADPSSAPSATEALLDQQAEIDPSIWRVKRAILKNASGDEQILAEYTDFLQVDALVFPTTMRFRTQGKENVAVDLKWSKLEPKKSLRFPFNVPPRYATY